MSPYAVMNQVRNITGKELKKITAATGNSFLLEVMSEVAGRKCTVSLHELHNQSKGIIYVQEYDIEDVDEFKRGLPREIQYQRRDKGSILLRHDRTVRCHL